MRKAAVMIGFGAFFLTLALLMRFYAYPKLAVIPSDQNTQQTVTDDHASYFDADTVKPGSGKIITKATVVAKQGDDEEGLQGARPRRHRHRPVADDGQRQRQGPDGVAADGRLDAAVRRRQVLG